MSVFTRVDSAQLDRFLDAYRLGRAVSVEPIEAGVTNSNYRLDTESGAWILTLYEHHDSRELDYILGLQRHLAGHGVRCAAPVVDRHGRLYSSLNLRPAAIIERLRGEVVAQPGRSHCAAVGAELARFHLAGRDFAGHRPDPRGLEWVLQMRSMLETRLEAADLELVDATLVRWRELDPAALPGGAIHADLFHDNVLFDADWLGGIFDFDYACEDSYVFDLAVLMNDWCIDAQGELVRDRTEAALNAYREVRSVERAEIDALPALLGFTALRFWLSRLHDLAFPLTGELIQVKPPDEFRRICELRLAGTADLFTDAKTGKNLAE